MLNFDPSGNDACPSDLTFDELRANELDPQSSHEVREHILQCQRCRERFEHLRRETDALAENLPPLQRHLATPSRRWGVTIGSLAAAAALLVVWVRRPTDGESDDGQTTSLSSTAHRTKGGPTLGFHVRRGTEVSAGLSGDEVRPGDAIQFHYDASEPVHLAIISRDASGVMSVFHPDADVTQFAPAGERVRIDAAIELDHVLGTEVVYGIFCEDRKLISELSRFIQRSPSEPPFPADCSYDRVVLNKVER